jgi:hypothetical protein
MVPVLLVAVMIVVVVVVMGVVAHRCSYRAPFGYGVREAVPHKNLGPRQGPAGLDWETRSHSAQRLTATATAVCVCGFKVCEKMAGGALFFFHGLQTALSTGR